MWTAPDNLRQYAFGWDIDQHFSGAIAKSGAQNGARSHIRIYPDEDLVIGVMSNRRGHDTTGLSIDIAETILGSASSASQPSQDSEAIIFNPLQEDGIIEPEHEAQDPAEVIWPIENPVATPSPEDLWEDDDESTVEYLVFLALLQR